MMAPVNLLLKFHVFFTIFRQPSLSIILIVIGLYLLCHNNIEYSFQAKTFLICCSIFLMIYMCVCVCVLI